MKLDLADHVTKEQVYEHFELFKEAYVFGEHFGDDWAMFHHLDWFNENAPLFLPVLDEWVINHIRANS